MPWCMCCGQEATSGVGHCLPSFLRQNLSDGEQQNFYHQFPKITFTHILLERQKLLNAPIKYILQSEKNKTQGNEAIRAKVVFYLFSNLGFWDG